MTGIKHDKGKSDYTYLEHDMCCGVADVFTFGAGKYTRDNWKHLEGGEQRFLQAAMRHLVSINSGDLYDDESGLRHIDHAITSLMMSRWHSIQNATV